MRARLNQTSTAALGALLVFAPAPTLAQVFIDTDASAGAMCVADGGQLVFVPGGDDCDEDFIEFPVYELTIGPDGSFIELDPVTGNATFGGSATFNGTTNLNGTTNINGPLNLAGSITAAGVTSTNGMTNTGSFTNNGNATITGTLNADDISGGIATFTGGVVSNSLSTGSITASSVGATNITALGFLQSNGGANLLGTTQLATVQVFQSLSVQTGATVDMNGNRITEVGTPVAGTDAVNKNYVDGLAGAAQTTANTALANAAAAQASADEAQATADTGLARTEALGNSTAAALGGGATYEEATGVLSAPSYSIGGASYGNVGAAFEAVDEELAMLDTRLGNLTEATEQGFRRANGGIATALALGGTMIVPDSAVSVSFNLATYRGEQGFSGAVVIQAAPKVYISGGVAGSTVKGSTGGRVGVAFGL